MTRRNQRLRIGIVFSHNENWVGGSYYLLNLISSFNQLKDSDRPEVFILSDKESDYEIASKTGYPNLKFLSFKYEAPYNLYQRIIFRFFPNYSKRNFRTVFDRKYLDVVFPFIPKEKLKKVPNKVFWYPDFQEYYYPEFFSEAEIKSRKELQKQFVEQNVTLILSSNSALNDFIKFFPNHKCKPIVVNFAVTHPDYQNLPIEDLKEKFQIKADYFISPNQFWQHKNHLTLLKAVKHLKDNGKKINIVFTGKEYDHRNPSYTDELKSFVKDHQLEDYVSFLGFIDRSEQLQLMNHSLAVVQPSLFEGWSTVVEDAKAMNQFLIVSDIPVHREQVTENVIFFESENYRRLAEVLIAYKRNESALKKVDYNQKILKFAANYLKAVTK